MGLPFVALPLILKYSDKTDDEKGWLAEFKNSD
jgi:hypothetical protein